MSYTSRDPYLFKQSDSHLLHAVILTKPRDIVLRIVIDSSAVLVSFLLFYSLLKRTATIINYVFIILLAEPPFVRIVYCHYCWHSHLSAGALLFKQSQAEIG
jgi:hypothetical protein